jgi:hypothetical protein
MRAVALPQPTTAGMPSSRATIAAWDSGAPTSVTTAAARGKSGVHPMFVTVVTRISPSPSWAASSGVRRTRAVPSATPAAPGNPVIVPAGAVSSDTAGKWRAPDSLGYNEHVGAVGAITAQHLEEALTAGSACSGPRVMTGTGSRSGASRGR